ncbi:hypothetical protein NBO_1225g0002 [Nosema bombycis CQ1]|uniref:Uncharacterized protein n=1 Tax=Nosema bombycis (strain CQ1 / CVCC 102059) TaxID=578461 RepID=R0MF82_NOSB1|nr:hypothetical protein NBO_1225g0002 [Nosema bombycis CQ1]|eukprot:EOB11388.1 hypothetical protein NBO_1225g0002 [Nosema bombycis CQ1]
MLVKMVYARQTYQRYITSLIWAYTYQKSITSFKPLFYFIHIDPELILITLYSNVLINFSSNKISLVTFDQIKGSNIVKVRFLLSAVFSSPRVIKFLWSLL